MTTLIGNEVFSNTPKRTQTFLATHDGEGNRLSLRDRSFLSFSWGGKNIEDFNLIATISGEAVTKSSYAPFEDLKSEYDVINGQFYWGNRYTADGIELHLATDEISEVLLDEFEKWFIPGKIRLLVLAESPNRGVWVRVAAAPTYSLLPFEEKTTVKINGIDYETSTTVYRGSIDLSFIMDEPFWFARNNIIENYYTNKEDKFGSLSSISGTATLQDKDFIKCILEDNIPHISMIKDSSIIFGEENKVIDQLSSKNPAYLYYSGTAPSSPIIKFTLTPKFVESYLVYPLNSYSSKVIEDAANYNTFYVGNKSFKFSTPGLFYGYNQAIDIVNKFEVGESVTDVYNALRDGINEYYSRAWAIYCINAMIYNNWDVEESGAIQDTFKDEFIKLMQYFLSDVDTSFFPATFSFDSKTGEAIGTFIIRVADAQVDMPTTKAHIREVATTRIEENVGDMIQSDYLTIEDRNYPNASGIITLEECSLVYTDYSPELTNVSIIFQNMYL